MYGQAKKLNDFGIVIPNQLGIHRVLQSLPPSYKNFVMFYNMQCMSKELPELFSMLKTAEVEIKKEHQVLMIKKTTSFKKQGKPKEKGNFKKGGKKVVAPPKKLKAGPKPDTMCYHCKGDEHWGSCYHQNLTESERWRTPVEYEDRNGKVGALREANLIGSSHDARSHGVNTVDLSHSIREPGFSFDANMAGFVIHHDADKAESSHTHGKKKDEAAPRDRPLDDDKRYLAEEEVRSMRYPRSLSVHLLSKYDQPYDRRHRYGGGDQRNHRSDANGRYRRNNDGYERRARGRSEEQYNMDEHWNCPFFRHCWDSGMSRLPTIGNCPRCTQQRGRTNRVAVFKRLGPLPPQSKRTESSQEEDFEESGREEDGYRQPRRCPDGLSQSRERRVQRPRSLEEAEARYLYMLRISRPDLATKIQRMVETKARPPKKVWRLKQAEDDAQASTDAGADASVDTDVAQEWTTYEQRHPESYQDKCRRVTLIEKDEDEVPARDQEFTNVEWTRGQNPCPARGQSSQDQQRDSTST
ncbi:hypothetical protein QYE76_067134 [Lolium multiflorum]|uniref:Uncharacterized protein n=1 Tax=Lolium multiflorum TaxID=4521 RepID=A0AAD8SCQ9_LOLMU|nr:hypothetical protein QYE76_067134 [Lolium multiflorum]